MQGLTNQVADAERAWAIDDPVVRLRVHGTAQTYDLPARPIDRWRIGAAADCDLVLDDKTGCVSRYHAELIRESTTWILRDRESTNGIYRNKERMPWFQLHAADEVELGGLLLIPESRRSSELRTYLARLIGWRRERAGDIDRALHAVREMARIRTALVLTGAGDLTRIARRIHDHVLGAGRPFIVTRSGSLAGLEQAATGTLCVVADHVLPADFAAASAQLREPESRVRVMICCSEPARRQLVMLLGQTASLLRFDLLEVPPLAARADELERLIAEFASDAAAILRATGPALRDREWQWLSRVELDTLEEIEAFTLRLVALRNWGVAGGAKRLRISHSALSRWAQRHHIPT